MYNVQNKKWRFFLFMVRLLCIGLALHFSLASFGQSYYPHKDIRFRHFQIIDGLPSNTIQKVIQDSNGFLWLGTQTGLVRYDGFEFGLLLQPDQDLKEFNRSSIHALHEDRKGFIWVGTYRHGIFRYDPKTGVVVSIKLEIESENSRTIQDVITIDEDKDGAIWAASYGGILSRIAPIEVKKDSFDIHTFQIARNTRLNSYPALKIDVSGNIWVGSALGLMKMSWDSLQNRPSFQAIDLGLQKVEVKKIEEGKRGELWLSTRYQNSENRRAPLLIKYSDNTKVANRYELAIENARAPYDILVAENKDIWLATQGQGIYSFREDDLEPSTGNTYKITDIKQYKFTGDDDFAVGRNYVYTLYQDDTGSIWIGTWLQGLYQISPSVNKFKHHLLPSNLQNPNTSVFTVFEDEPDNYWVSTYLNGLYRFDFENQSFRNFGPENKSGGIQSKVSMDIMRDSRNQLWVLSGGRMLNKYDDSKKGFTSYQLGNDLLEQGKLAPWQKNTFLLGISEDSNGDFWIGSNGLGLFHFDPEKGETLGHYFANPNDSTSLGSNNVMRSYVDSENSLWLSCDGMGLYKLITKKDGNIGFQRCTPSVNTIYSIAEDQKDRLWLGTLSEGLIHYNKTTSELRYFTSEDGLPHNTIDHIIVDDKGFLWLVTPSGLGRFNPETGQCTNFGREYGLAFGQRLMNKGSKRNQKIVVGTTDGFYEFQPDQLEKETLEPRTRLTGLLLNNQKELPYTSDLLYEDLPYTNSITLPYNKNDIAIQYSGLYFDNAQRLKFSYRLEGSQKDWIDVGIERIARFSSLPPGDYTFQVRSGLSENSWGLPASIAISIRPPWWKSTLAYMVYGLILITSLYYLYKFQLNRRLRMAETARLKELDAVKSTLYTNLTHEFRTPLTIIIGMAREMMENPKTWFREGLDMVLRNASHLHRLIDQMLDLSKLESGGMKVHMQQSDIIAFLKYIIGSFQSYAQQQAIDIHFSSSQPEMLMDFDPDKVLNIVSNLLGNAIKFTPKGGDIYVSAKWLPQPLKMLEVSVRDNGIGVAAEHLPHIFDRFYRAEVSEENSSPGTGIGLALTKELVLLLKGEIRVQSEVGRGTEFIITLPVTNKASKTQQLQKEQLKESLQGFFTQSHQSVNSEEFDSDKPELLIVEDNEDVTKFLVVCLQDEYSIKTAADGDEGLKKAVEAVPDIIISDVMMPKMNGFELCEKVKTDIRTSHIPLILLTAKADQQAKIEGLEHGADAYLTKPFDKKELLTRLRKLHELRKVLQRKFSLPNAYTGISKTATATLDEQFLGRINEILETQLDNDAFGITELCSEYGISRVQLHRKLKALTELSTSHYIRRYKLHRATELIKTTEMTISEVAYAVGFKSPAYFTQVFSEVYQHPPSELRSFPG